MDDRAPRLTGFVRAFFTNWRDYDAPLSTKVRMTAVNRVRALRRGCCGHHGEPGC